jgi:hypothetical protein
MTKRSVVLSLLAGSLLATTAMAQSPGDIVYTDVGPVGAGSYVPRIRAWFSSSATTGTLLTFPSDNGNPNQTTTRLSDIRMDPSGNFYVGNGPVQQPVSVANIKKIQNLFTSPVVSVFTSSNPTINPLGMAWDTRTNSLLYVNNTNMVGTVYPAQDGGINAVGAGGGAPTRIWNQGPTSGPGLTLPTPALAQFLEKSPIPGSDDYYVTIANGGEYLVPQGTLPANQNWSSQIYRMSFSNISPGSATLTQIVDFHGPGFTTFPGVPLLTDVRGIAVKPGTNSLFVTDNFTKAIYEVLLNGLGNYAGLNLIYQLGPNSAPEVIRYDPFTDTLVYSDLGLGTLNRVTLNGATHTVLDTGVYVRGIEIVPTPGTLALLGLGGLVAARRRRRMA